MHFTIVVGARPNFIKAAPVLRELGRMGLAVRLVHTGQHYDREMSDVFFDGLQMPKPDVYLGVGSGSHAEQTAAVIVGLERELLSHRPDMLIVVGDVNSTMASALAAAKLGVPVAHVEAGLRSFDRSMPEEINRIVTDSVSELLLTSEESANRNLAREGHPPEHIRFVGNVMIDSLLANLDRAAAMDVPGRLGLAHGGYAVLTLHRPSNVDDAGALAEILSAVAEISKELPVVFPAHPRTSKRLGGCELPSGMRVLPPLGYLEFLSLMRGARLVFTDSGGIQEETTVLGIPCLTLRENTERPVTVELGTNTLVGRDRARILAASRAALDGKTKKGTIPPLWDGRTAQRIAEEIAAWSRSGKIL